MNPAEKESLSKMIKDNNVQDNTDNIRDNKHSQNIKSDIDKFINLKKQYSRLAKSNKNLFKEKVKNQCNFLYTNYNNIFNKLINEQLDLDILNKFVFFLKKIEDGDLDQHSASYEIGKLLKNHYIDTKLGEDKSNKDNDNSKITAKNISWQEYKFTNLKKD